MDLPTLRLHIGLGLLTLWTTTVIGQTPAILAPGARPIELLKQGAGEGPAWHPQLGLLTSGGGHINRRALDGTASIYRRDAGSNGLLFDRSGRLIICEPVKRRVTRLNADGTLTVLTDRYQGGRYNQPNDVAIDSKNRIYFTDPRYGPRTDMQLRDADNRAVEGVYRIDPSGQVTRIITHAVDRPNGLVVTPDEVPAGASGLKIESRVGTEILQSSNTANMIWGVARSIAIISEYTTLMPGDHIALGTPPGVGHAKKPNPRWLVPGETVEIEIEGIGICASPVLDEAAIAAQAAAE